LKAGVRVSFSKISLGLKVFVLLGAVWTSLSVQSLPTLQSLPPHPQFSFDPSEDSEIPSCEDLLPRMIRLRKIIDESQFSLITFLQESSSVIEGWHSRLEPLEGQQGPLPSGIFLPLKEGAESILDLTDLAYENSDYVSNEMLKMIQALTKCHSQQGGHSGRSLNN